MTVTDLHSKASRMRSREPVGFRLLIRLRNHAPASACGEDETGEGFIYEMFLDELDNHEYGYTRDTEDTLYALGYTADEVLGNPRLKRGIEKAVTEICGRD